MRWFEFLPRGEGVAFENRDGQLWGAVTVRQDHECRSCGDPIAKGSRCYRPMSEGNGTLRFFRVCVTCVAEQR